MNILGIDPGPQHSAVAIYSPERHEVLQVADERNDVLRTRITNLGFGGMWQPVIETMTSYGAPVGQETFDTLVWIGRFDEIFAAQNMDLAHLSRKAIVGQICGTARAGDRDVRQAICDRFDATGRNGKGEPDPVGVNEHPGPLHGVSGHKWAALAAAIAFAEMQR